MKRYKLVFIGLLLSICSLTNAQNLNDVYAAMGEEDWEVALELVQPLLKKKRNHEAKWLAAICHANRYRFETSYQLFEEALPYAEFDPFFWVPYAQAYLYGGRVDEAERLLRRTSPSDFEDEYFQEVYVKVLNNIRAAQKYMPNPERVVVQNLGAKINTEGNEYSQVVRADQRGIYFTARREGLGEMAADGEYYEHLLRSSMNKFDKWAKDEEVEGYDSGSDFLAPLQLLDNDSTIIYYKNEDIYMARLQANGQYGNDKPLPFNTPKWESHAFVYNNHKSIIFASDFGNNDENADLYITHLAEDGQWTKPYLIQELSTDENEDAPFVAGDGTLYFSSRGHDSMGGYDIFKTRLDSATGKFSAPENLGAPINLPGDDTFFTLYGKYAYLSSNREAGYGENDIYKVFMFNASKLQGKFIDCDNRPFANARLTVTEFESGEVTETTTDEYGVYELVVPIEQKVVVKLEKNGEVFYEKDHFFRVLFRDQFDIEHDFLVGDCASNVMEDIYLTMINSYDLDPLNIQTDPPSIEGLLLEEEIVAAIGPAADDTEAAVVAALPSLKLPIIFFDFDKSAIKAEYFDRLNEAVELLKERTDLKILIAGHTDSYGTNLYNTGLGKKRYEAVYKYFVDKGVDPEQLEVKSFSENVPIASNNTRQGRAYNRRVELSFVNND
ncbi:OmpA family protein [Roseivirga pacifica]|uniref:OmpA family protein n=1 Tax=Roseivirga pacifica TaxID=1267423 RepID=UPI0020943945|nr:OmpA family protein [Roseivirga pacifica]MCO6360709.1 OmpA family protein [Roseivirga pacifica]MCO6368598.1 OmpA family protein [Roseivirga pacifica]MCO6372741.1 OmpA family protein [Roseivirga pacifica]MCO6376799.1 OmpA family protein [Roseivirga pacifica]MCO6377922.1 OmpA family protein [Roseivirga pacifica]